MATALHLDALTLVTRLHLLEVCCRAVQVAQQQCPPQLPAGPGGAPRVYAEESLLLARAGLWMGLTRGRDLIIDSAPILAWRRADPDAAFGHAPAHHPRPLLLGYRVHTLLCRGSRLGGDGDLQRPPVGLRP